MRAPDRRRVWRLGLTARGTNLALFTTLLLAYATGTVSETVGAASGWWAAAAHAATGTLVLLLLPGKRRVVRHGLRRARATRWLSLLMGALLVLVLVAGVGSATGVVRSIGGREALWVHVAAALVVAPLVLWHAAARPARPRRTDVSRRTVLRTGMLGALAVGGLATSNTLVDLLGLPGARRRFTGSHERGSFDPARMPSSIWLDDTTPVLDAGRWALTVTDAAGTRRFGLDELRTYDAVERATLDCTSGWYAEQDWTGAPLSALVGDVGAARSIVITSVTGYSLRFPVEDLDRLLLATAVGGEPLRRGHGYPLRLVAPGRRGFWWVKWVESVEVQDRPAWLRSPFPLT